jgi:hypothetical protein
MTSANHLGQGHGEETSRRLKINSGVDQWQRRGALSAEIKDGAGLGAWTSLLAAREELLRDGEGGVAARGQAEEEERRRAGKRRRRSGGAAATVEEEERCSAWWLR